MYALVLDWFRVTNKNNYARICLDYIWIILSLNPALVRVWDEYRTCSLVGNAGRNIAWDQANEFMNLFVKNKKPMSPQRIDKLILMLNGLRESDSHLRAGLGSERADPVEYTHVKRDHVDAIVQVIRDIMGDGIFGDNRKHKTSSPFGHGAAPWRRVRNPSNLAPNATAGQLRQAKHDWITQKLDEDPFPANNNG